MYTMNLLLAASLMAALLHIQSVHVGLLKDITLKKCLCSTNTEGIERIYFPFEIFLMQLYFPLCV